MARTSIGNLTLEGAPDGSLSISQSLSSMWTEDVTIATLGEGQALVIALLRQFGPEVLASARNAARRVARTPAAVRPLGDEEFAAMAERALAGKGTPRRLTLEAFNQDALPPVVLEGTLEVEVPEGMDPEEVARSIRSIIERQVQQAGDGSRSRARLVLEVEAIGGDPDLSVEGPYEGGEPAEAPRELESIAPDVLRDLLSLVLEVADMDALLGIVERWSPEERAEAERWAGASHIRASDHDDVEVPPVPACVAALQRGAGEFISGEYSALVQRATEAAAPAPPAPDVETVLREIVADAAPEVTIIGAPGVVANPAAPASEAAPVSDTLAEADMERRIAEQIEKLPPEQRAAALEERRSARRGALPLGGAVGQTGAKARPRRRAE